MVDDNPLEIRRIIKELFNVAGFSNKFTERDDESGTLKKFVEQDFSVDLEKMTHGLWVYSQFTNISKRT